ncbi:hypothetical protein PSZ67_24205, partial [Shigella sonnei]|nr:hypothetical protein [Shigella sonnei]
SNALLAVVSHIGYPLLHSCQSTTGAMDSRRFFELAKLPFVSHIGYPLLPFVSHIGYPLLHSCQSTTGA